MAENTPRNLVAEASVEVTDLSSSLGDSVYPETSSAGPRRRRLAGIVQGAATGFASRLIGLAISLLSVPLTIGYLGAERYGVWVTVGSALAWISLADLGIGNGLTNAVAEALGNDRPDLARKHISTSFFSLCAISITVGALVAIAWPFFDWPSVFGVRTHSARAEVGPAIAAAVIFTLVGFPLGLIGKVYLASQEGKLANYWGAGSNIAGLLSLFIVTRTQGGLVWLVVAVSGTGLLVTLSSGVWLFLRHKPHLAPHPQHVSISSVKEMGQVGPKFFLIQIMALIVFQTDNLAIAHFLGAAKVAPYSITYKWFGYTSFMQTLLFSYVWAAYSDSLARRDFAWVRRTFRQNLIFSSLSTLVLVIPLLIFARPFIKIWAGVSAVPPFDLCVWMAVWSLINAFTSPIACLFAAAAHLKAQLLYAALSTVANVGLTITLIPRWGITGAIAGTVISYLVFVCVPCFVDAILFLRRLPREL